MSLPLGQFMGYNDYSRVPPNSHPFLNDQDFEWGVVMALTTHEFWTVIHGLVLGSVFLLAFASGAGRLWSLRPEFVTFDGMQKYLRRLNWGVPIMAIVAWLMVLTGTYIVAPWYWAKPPEGADLTLYPLAYLMTDSNLAVWHTFGMEWKEHIAWFSPILATAVAYVVWRYGDGLAERPRIRQALLLLFILSFVVAGVASLTGAFLNKIAPIR